MTHQRDLQPELRQAIKENNIDTVARLLSDAASPELKVSLSHDSPLHCCLTLVRKLGVRAENGSTGERISPWRSSCAACCLRQQAQSKRPQQGNGSVIAIV